MGGINKVLIVEDDPVQQKMLVAYFESRDVASCLCADNGEEAIALIEEHTTSIQLITCDLNMPDHDGIELLDFLRSVNTSIPIVIITSARTFVSESAALIARAHGLNFLGIIRKPAKSAELTRIIAPLLGY